MIHYESNKEYLLQRELGIRLILRSNPFITPYEIVILLNGGNHFAKGELGGKISAVKKTIKRLTNDAS